MLIASRIPRKNSAEKIRARPTTLDIPGLTKSRVSPDGKIAQRDVGSKLVIIMVGLPARGKSYITKKMARYLNWLQHDTKIFNVGERRRVAAGGPVKAPLSPKSTNGAGSQPPTDSLTPLANVLLNGENAEVRLPKTASQTLHNPAVNCFALPELHLPGSEMNEAAEPLPGVEIMDQSADFFNPDNIQAALLREQCAMETLDDLLDYILEGGSVGILDATNSTLERRQALMRHIRTRAGPDLNVLFIESECVDENLLERNMRLKLSGPDYKGKDPKASLADFKKRVECYEMKYVPLGDYEEKNNMPYVKMIDVGRKIITHQIKGFLSAQAVYYLLNFNLAPRQIWITRHGQSTDNVDGRIGGDSKLTAFGRRFGDSLHKFVAKERSAWEVREIQKEKNAHLPPVAGDVTPPNPHYDTQYGAEYFEQKNFCVWTSMLQRSVDTADSFDADGDFDIKQMRMLNELYSGDFEGLTYEEIKTRHHDQYEKRREDKLHYRYPGPGGEGYLDVVNRLRPVIMELERMTDHCLLITHRSVARILLAYFKGLDRAEVADLDVPLGKLYCLEPVSRSRLSIPSLEASS